MINKDNLKDMIDDYSEFKSQLACARMAYAFYINELSTLDDVIKKATRGMDESYYMFLMESRETLVKNISEAEARLLKLENQSKGYEERKLDVIEDFIEENLQKSH